MKRSVATLVLVFLVLDWAAAAAQESPEVPSGGSTPPPGAVCDVSNDVFCRGGGSGGDDVSADDRGDEELVRAQVWGEAEILDGVCEGDPPRPRVLQWLVWG